MRIAVFGLGYVGAVTAAALAARGHIVIGIDTAAAKVDEINMGHSPVIEPGLAELIAQEVAAGRLSATTDAGAAVRATELCLICVGTPSQRNGSIDTEALERVARTIGTSIADLPHRYTIVVRSTVIPGTTERVVIPELEAASGLRVGAEFGVAVNPEFLREGSSLHDFNNPAKTVIGAVDEQSAETVGWLYDDITNDSIATSLRSAEFAKYIDNMFHAVKVAFANEIGAYCRVAGVDQGEVLRSFLADTKLNISSAYLTPGFAFGGSCLPKDLRALTHDARHRDLSLPLLEHVLDSNQECIQRALQRVEESGAHRVGLFGLAFKTDTDDLRESPFVELAERLVGKGYRLRIYDPVVSPPHLVGSNRSYIHDRLPHLSMLLTGSPAEVIAESELVIVGNANPAVLDALTDTSLPLIDLCRVGEIPLEETRYAGARG